MEGGNASRAVIERLLFFFHNCIRNSNIVLYTDGVNEQFADMYDVAGVLKK